MKDRRILYGVIGLVFFLIGIVAYLPAAVVTGWLAGATPLRFNGVTGTVFNGEAAYVSLPDGGIDNVSWRIRPASLLLGRVTSDIKLSTDLGNLSATYTRTLLGYNRIADLSGEATLGWAARLGGYTFVPTSGRLAADIDRLDFDDDLDITTLAGHVNITNTRYELLNPALALGRFDVDLASMDDNGIRATITDSRGPLALTGHADVTANQRYQLDVRLRARAGADDRLKRVLSQLGKPGPDGWYDINERGRL
ncbi:type II secretion system protein N [Salinisphaera sp. Q1T1-3]|uniref:type II secretion system protein N n=1 Tax=Salinisphaera sp. Q1T1-3 TaxID=2321229 RepID=UPI000E74F203|nr:type II secretion system protein N [Salinisphaera sp. Q1T1-3]RJS91763.1 type II secretion system protein N [Salinisphaera sp. Q1T1-3]